MNTLKLSDLIGQEIKELRFHYVAENEFGLQSFHSYIKLDSDTKINIPNFDDDEFFELNPENIDFLKKMFDSGSSVNEKLRGYFTGQKISDFYFNYYNNEVEPDKSAYIKLSNNYYLTEHNFGPVGLTNINLEILDEQQFLEKSNYTGVDIRSFLNRKNSLNKSGC